MCNPGSSYDVKCAAAEIVENLVESRQGVAVHQILENPEYYPGAFAYQKDAKFTRITARNFSDYTVIGKEGSYTYAVSPFKTTGFVFSDIDIEEKPKLGMVPVMTVSLRDSSVKGYKQAHHLRIRESFAKHGIATTWYVNYVQIFGGIVSDFEHLEGGKTIWRSFVNKAQERGLKVSLVNTLTGEWRSVSEQTPDNEIWSTDQSKKLWVLVLERQ